MAREGSAGRVLLRLPVASFHLQRLFLDAALLKARTGVAGQAGLITAGGH